MTETDLSNEIKKALTKQELIEDSHVHAVELIRFDYMRLESHSTIQGLPDANLCVQSKEGFYAPEIWLELKIGKETPRPLQVSWARRRWELGQHNIYCIRGYETVLSHKPTVCAFVEPMNIYWAAYKPLPNMVMTMDRLAYFLLTGEEYRDNKG